MILDPALRCVPRSDSEPVCPWCSVPAGWGSPRLSGGLRSSRFPP